MIDIHSHPLPEVDDGARSFEVAVEMCQMAAEDGTTHLVATPHSNYSYTFDPDLNRQLAAELQARVGENPKLLLGCDFHLSYDNIQICVQNSKDFTINHTPYLLVELPDQFIPEHLSRVYYDIQVAGLHPIITHPERNLLLQRKPELLAQWVSMGCLVQVTAQSYTGGFGPKARRYAEMLLDAGSIHFFASDAHDTKRRPPLLSPCYRKVADAKGEEIADLLLNKNPEAIINGQPLPPQPDWAEDQSDGKKRSWFSFLWRH
ncbi:MAG: tyrosine-protein phosphatase [Terriglobia bacterium]